MKYLLRWSHHGSHHSLEARHLHDLFHYMTLQVKNPSNARGKACFDKSICVLDIFRWLWILLYPFMRFPDLLLVNERLSIG